MSKQLVIGYKGKGLEGAKLVFCGALRSERDQAIEKARNEFERFEIYDNTLPSRRLNGCLNQESEGTINATDEAQELADSHGIPLAEIQGTGQGGRVRKGDVEAFLEQEKENLEAAKEELEEQAREEEGLLEIPEEPEPLEEE